MRIGRTTYRAIVLRTAGEQFAGVQLLGGNVPVGVALVFPADTAGLGRQPVGLGRQPVFTMRDTRVPLVIVGIRAGMVVGVVRAMPGWDRIVMPAGCDAVVELREGAVVKVGDRVGW